MAENFKRGSGTREHSDQWYYERCHPKVREALRAGPFTWSSSWALTYQKKHGVLATLARLRKADEKATKEAKGACYSLRMKPIYSPDKTVTH